MVVYKLTGNGEGILANGRFVPENTELAAWNDYLAFVAAGGTPEAADAVDLEAVRQGALDRLDLAANVELAKWSPAGLVGDLRRDRIAEAVLADGDGTPTAGEYPILNAAIPELGADLAAVATAVLAERDTVRAGRAAIEQVRSAARVSIGNQTDVAGIEAALAAVAWPADPA